MTAGIPTPSYAAPQTARPGTRATPVRIAAYLIPVTSGIDLMQDVMLRGSVREPWQAGVLAALALVLLLACWLLLRRGMSRA